MAVAPLNKFLTIAVPVAPGEQTVYTTPVGVSAIMLYAQVSNVAGITTYPTVTFTHRRKSTASKTAGNTRNNRIIKDAEIPPNDSLIIIDGRLVVERSALISDSIVIEGTQSGIVTVTDCKYTNATGITTLTTLTAHNFNEGDEVIVPSNTYIATWLAVSQCGATPVPVEPDPKTYNIDPALIEAAISPRTKVILPVHLYGQPADMDPILKVAKNNKHQIIILFDEIQWISKSQSGFLGYLKEAWLDWRKSGKIKLIISGSSNKFFTKNIHI